MAEQIRIFGPVLLVVGAALAAAGYLRVVAAGAVAGPLPAAVSPPAVAARTYWLYALLAIAVVALAVRLIGLDAKGISHPEAYIPGLDLPAGLSEPPPRHGLAETARWHFHSEPHPFGYYLAMWAWTQAAGASLFSIRLPEAILGAASVLLVYRVGAMSYGRPAGLIAAALLSLHGFHVFWSQAARMYAPGGFLGLLSTWLLLELAAQDRPRRGLEAAYVASLVATALTVEFLWPLLAVHMLWTALKGAGRAPLRLSVLQALAAIVAAPMLSHALMTGRNEAVDPPTLQFMVDYLSFGFLFQHGAYSDAWAGLPPAAGPLVLVFGLALVGLGLAARVSEPAPVAAASPDWPWRLALAAAGACALMLGFMAISYVRRRPMAVASVLPWLMLTVPLAAAWIPARIAALGPWAARLVERGRGIGLVPLLALAPAIGIFLISFKLTLTAPRAFLIFVPYLLILVAAGVVRLSGRRILVATVGAVLAVMFAASVAMMARTPISPRDYRGLADAIEANLAPGDLIFVPSKHWAYTPILLYLPHDRLVADRYAETLAAAPAARVWVMSFEDRPRPAIQAALVGRPVVQTVTALRASASVYGPAEAARR